MNEKSVQIPSYVLQDGTLMPCMGLGTFGSDRVSARDVALAVKNGLEAGYRMFDCAACYGNEAQIGEVFRDFLETGSVPREELFIMTKVWNDMHRKVEESCRKSIADLQCGYIDLFFIHWPFPNYHAPFCDVDARNPDSRPFSEEEFLDTYRQCEALVEKGLIRRIGLSNMTIRKLEAVWDQLRIKPAACESEIHPTFQQRELVAWLQGHGVQPVAYMPLGSPRRPERDIMPEDITDLEDEGLKRIAAAHGCSPAAVCLKWSLQLKLVPIPFSVHHGKENLMVTQMEDLTEEEMAQIAGMEQNNRLVKGQVFLWEGAEDWHELWDE